MKRGILIAVAVLVALAAAPALWLVLDDGGGDRRSAALVEPTASGDVGRLTLTGVKSGVLTIPVQSFSWGMVVPQSASTGQASGQARHNPLQIIKPIDANSPVLFSMLVTNENLSSAKLDLLNAGGAPYLTYNFANASIGNWDDDTSEKLTLYYQSFTASLLKAVRPVAPGGQVVGQLTAPSIGAASMPIVGFAAGVSSPRDPASGLPTGKRQHKPATIRRAIDSWDPAVLTKVAQGSVIPSLTVELQRPDANGVMQTYATYTYTNAVPSSVEDSGAAGAVATQELRFSFQKVELKMGGNTATDDSASAAA
ncbi:MAG: type VI secretion system tube protein Hcp [Gaiellaceae bacterium]